MEGFWDCRTLVLGALDIFQILLELFLKTLEVRDCLCFLRHEAEESVKRLWSHNTRGLLLESFLVFILLHPGRQLSQREIDLGIALHPLLSGILGSLNHLLVERRSHSPRDNAGLEGLVMRVTFTLSSVVLCLFLVS